MIRITGRRIWFAVSNIFDWTQHGLWALCLRDIHGRGNCGNSKTSRATRSSFCAPTANETTGLARYNQGAGCDATWVPLASSKIISARTSCATPTGTDLARFANRATSATCGSSELNVAFSQLYG